MLEKRIISLVIYGIFAAGVLSAAGNSTESGVDLVSSDGRSKAVVMENGCLESLKFGDGMEVKFHKDKRYSGPIWCPRRHWRITP